MKVGREQSFLILLAVIGIGIIGAFYFQKVEKGIVITSAVQSPVNPEVILQPIEKVDNPPEDIISEPEIIIVHVAGEVQRPGVYELLEGSRVIDAVQKASGATQYADLDALNLAAPIYDGEKIYIPSIFETAPHQGEFNNGTGSFQAVAGVQSQGGLININSASLEELMKLPGIGPSKAKNIIDYRNKIGRFREKEELLEVSGIGEKTLEKIEDMITIR